VGVNPNEFWQNIGQIEDRKIRKRNRESLHYLERYFVEVQYLPIPGHEKDAAQNHLTRIHREIDRRKNFWLVVAAIVAGAVVTFVAAWWQIRATGQTSQLSAVTEKQYVSIVESNITALAAGSSPTLTIVLENGPGKTNVNFHEVNFLLTSPTKHLKYAPNGKPEPFTMTPHQRTNLIWNFDEFKPSQAQLDDLSGGSLQLYFFAKGSYTDEAGNTESLDLCRQYNGTVSSHLIYCPSDVKID